MRAVVALLIVAANASDLLDLKDTFVITAEKTREINSVTPRHGTALGGTRIHIEGEGFATEFYSGSNTVYIGKSNTWVQCDVVEGACTVDCGGDKRIVCDTQPWTSTDQNSGWLDVWVVVEDSISTYNLVKSRAFHYWATSNSNSPKVTGVWPRHAAAGDVLTMTGEALGESVADYRMIYVGKGRPPQGANINDARSSTATTHAACRADDLNLAINPDSGEVDSFSLPIMVEDAVIGHDSPIKADQVNCYLGDFASGSYNISALMGTTIGSEYGGLTAFYATNISRDAYGEYYTIQYFPHVARVTPALGSIAGGTLLTISGGGFSDNSDDIVVTVGGIECIIETSTLNEITCRTGAFLGENVAESREEPVSDDVGGWELGDENATELKGNWSRVKSPAASFGSFSTAPGCPSPPCTASWIVLAPNDVMYDGLYEFHLVTPSDESSTFKCNKNGMAVLVSDSVRGYVAVDLSAATKTESTIYLGNFSVAAGTYDGRRGAVVVDTTGVEGCIAVDGVKARRVGPIGGSNCSDPLATNFNSAANFTTDCVYVGGRGLKKRSWSLLAPEYRDKGTWYRDLDILDAYGSELPDGTIRRCSAPQNASNWDRDALDRFHDQCDVDSYCCLTNDHYGCDATWDTADKDGWVDVLRQDLQHGRPFKTDEWRRNAHDRRHENFAILDEIEMMRSLEDGSIEFMLDWPDKNYLPMQWSQALNPTLYNSRTKSEQYDEEVGLDDIDNPYSGYDFWGGLEYNGEQALLDGSYNNDAYYFQVGALEGSELLANAGNTATKARLRARPNSLYFEPKCIDCLACYDEDGYERGAAQVRTRDTNCSFGEDLCTLNATTFDYVVGCPERCKGLKLRSFEASAPHHAAIVASSYQNCTLSSENNASSCNEQSVASDISVDDALTVGSYEGFFVAPVSANYTILATWDAALELSLGDDADPRSRKVVLGKTAPVNGDRVGDDWYFFEGHWYRTIENAELSWPEAQMACKTEGGYLAQIESREENDFIFGLVGSAGDAVWLGASDIDVENVWVEYKGSAIIGVDTPDNFVAEPLSFSNWNNNEPNNQGNQDCLAMWTSFGNWDDRTCTNELNFVCETETAMESAGPFSIEKGEARYFELNYVHNETNAANGVGPKLGLWLEIATGEKTYQTRVMGEYSLSMEFFREKVYTPTVSVAVGASNLAASCDDCTFAYSEDATPVVETVSPRQGYGGDRLIIEGMNFPVGTIGDVSIGIGGAACDVASTNGTVLECVLSSAQAQAGTYPVIVRVDGLGNSLVRVNFTVLMAIEDFSPKNGSVLGGNILQIWGSGFSRLGTQNHITIGDVECVPRTLKNRACRVSEFDSGDQCAWTVTDWYGYEMVQNAYADSNKRARAEWLDFSNTTYIECVIQDNVVADEKSWPVVVKLLPESDLVDDNAVVQKYTKKRATELDYSTRNIDCHVLLGWRIWNVQGDNSTKNDCALLDEEYNQAGVFGEDYVYFNGSSATSLTNYSFLSQVTPVIEGMEGFGMAGQEITIVGRNLEANVAEWNFNWYMDEFGFYAQQGSPEVWVGTSPTVVTFANDSHIRFLPTYNVHEIEHEVRVWVRGRGRAVGDEKFTYANYIYEVSPNAGSTLGGTLLTLTGSGFATTTTFYAEESGESLGSSTANYVIKLASGGKCQVQSASETVITCVTQPAASSEAAVVEVEVLWNSEPFFFSCAAANCTPPGCAQIKSSCKFAYLSSATPHLRLRGDMIHDGSPYYAPGDTVSFDILEGDFAQEWNSINSTSDVKVFLGSVPCEQTELIYTNRTLRCVLSADTVPQADVEAVVLVYGYGYAIIENKITNIRPVIESISTDKGSLAGGLTLSIAGRGFAKDFFSHAVVAGTILCENAGVDSSKLLTCVTSSIRSTPVDATVSGNVFVIVNSTQSACEATACTFSYETGTTPVVDNITNVGTHAIVHGKGFGMTDNEIWIGYEKCEVASESETSLSCKLPSHAAGLYPITISVPGKGNAAGYQLWMRFALFTEVTEMKGSMYGGQSVTLAGSGFPACTPAKLDDTSVPLTCSNVVECTWNNVTVEMKSNSEYFSAVVVESYFDKISMITTLQGLDGVDSDAVDAVPLELAVIGPYSSGAEHLMSSSRLVGTELFNGDQQSRLFDNNLNRFWVVRWDGYERATVTYDFGTGKAIGEYRMFIDGNQPCPISWVLLASEDGTEWKEIDSFFYNATNEDCTRVYRGSEVSEPGLYRYYSWQFDDVYFNHVQDPLWIAQIEAWEPSFKSTNVTFSRSAMYTPEIDAVTPPKGGFRQVIGLSGNFLDDDVSVRVGGQPCPIHWANSTNLECATPNVSAGSYPVILTSSKYGLAGPLPPLTYEVEMEIWNMTLSAGSLGGGTVVTFYGFGFAESTLDNRVTIAGAECAVVETFESFTDSFEPTIFPTSQPTSIPTRTPDATTIPTPIPTPLPTPLPSPLISPFPTPSSTSASSPDATTSPTPLPTPLPSPLPTQMPTSKSRRRLLADFFAPDESPERRSRTDWNTRRIAEPSGYSYSYDSTFSILPTTVPTMKANAFNGFEYFGSLTCVTGGISENHTITARPKLSTRLKDGSRLVLHSGRNGHSSYGGASFIAIEYECRMRKLLLELSSSGIAFAFYSPISRSLVDSLTYSQRLTTSRSSTAANFINRYADRDDLLLLVITSYNLRVESSPLLIDAIKECGGSTLLSSLASSSGSHINANYALVARCGAGYPASHFSNVGLEKSERYSADIDIDVGELFFFDNGRTSSPFNFTYDEKLTPRVVAMSRLNGTTAGGTTLRINVTNAPSNVTVTLGGVICATKYKDIGSYRGVHLCEWDGVDCSNLGSRKIVGENVTELTCLTNPWDYSGDAKDTQVVVTAAPFGNALILSGLTWSYIDLWSALTTWGGDQKNVPTVGDSVTITQGQYIVMDVSPPPLFLLIVYGGVLEFSPDVGDLALNASYIFVFGGSLRIGTEEAPFPNKAVITLEGDRNSLELPVYGAKCLAVRDAILDLHGMPSTTTWVRLASSVKAGNFTLTLDAPVDWAAGDQIFITSTSFDPLETEERLIAEVLDGGYTITLTKALLFDHWGEGYVDPRTGELLVPEYRAEVGRLSRNVVVQGDDVSKRQQFGAQIIFASSQNYDNSIIARLSNVEVRQAGQGLKIGKYPIHFHLVGKVDKSYVVNCSVHHANNRAIAIHGISHLKVLGNVVFDTRGHGIFIEDGTETRNVIAYNLVAVIRPIWSLLLVDQSPAAYWIVNPDNDVYGNVAAGSSHYGFWYRSLERPDGIGGQRLIDTNVKQCPMHTPLGLFYGNVAHSTKRHGLKLSDYFPAIGGASCASDTFGFPATFSDFVGYNNGRFGIWGEFLIDVNFDHLRILNPGIGGMEFLYMNGRGSEFARSSITNSFFVGRTTEIATAGPGDMCEGLQDVNGAVNHDGNGCIHAIHLPGLGSELDVINVTFFNFEAPLWTCSWCVGIKGGYEVDFSRVNYTNVTRPATFKKGFGGDIATSGILNDLDGSLGTGTPGGVVVPYAGHFENNPNCDVGLDLFDEDYGEKEYVMCSTTVRRISLAAKMTSSYVNTRRLYRFPHARIIDVTDRPPNFSFGNLFDEPYWTVQRGDQSCVEQAPFGEYLFLLATGREYALLFRDQVGIPVTVTGRIYAARMKPDESIVLRLSHKAPFQAAASYAEVRQLGESRWGENTMNIGWEPSPPQPPDYSIGAKDSASCALSEFSRCSADSMHQTPELRDSLKLVDGRLEFPLIALPTGRTTRGGRLFPAGNNDVWLVVDLLEEGSGISFTVKGSNDVLSSRWRHGFDPNTRKFEFFSADDGYSSTTKSERKNGTHTISPVEAPFYCWDLAREGRKKKRVDPWFNPNIELWSCDDETAYQDWIWIPADGGGYLQNAGFPNYCVGSSDVSKLDGSLPLSLQDCDDALLFDKSWLTETEVDATHGIYSYDRLGGPAGYDADGITWDNTSTTNWFPRGQIPYDQTNISSMTVLLAGNSTVNIETSQCGPEGCPYRLPVCTSCENRVFRWESGNSFENAANWNVTGDPTVDVPSDYWSGTIWDGWTVIIDQDTPVVNKLVVRGVLVFDPNANVDMTLHAHYITVDGGTIIMGNETDPIGNLTSATLSLHGDRYLSTVRKNGKWERVYNFKRIDVNGNFSVHGQRVTTWLKLGAHAFAGDQTIRLEKAVSDWLPGDVLTISHTKHHGAGQGNTRATEYEEYTIENVSGHNVTLTAPLKSDYVGEIIDIAATEATKASTVDVRAVVANNRRNARILGADSKAFDRLSGLTSQEQGYGAQIRGRDSRIASKPGWVPTMPQYDVLGTEFLPTGWIDVKFATFERCGKGFFNFPIVSWDGYSNAEAISYSSEQSSVEIEGIRSAIPFVGSAKKIHNYFVDGFFNSALRFTNNVFVGVAFKFGPNNQEVTHVVKSNAFLGDGAGNMCAGGFKDGICPDMYMVELGHSSGYLSVAENVFHGAFVSAVHISRPCSSFSDDEDFASNVVLSSYIGVSIAGCSSLNVRTHLNSVGVLAGDVGKVSNIVAAANGFGLLPAAEWDLKPQKFFDPNLDLHADLTGIEDSIFVGVLLDLQRIGFESDCVSWTGVRYGFEEHWINFRDWDYSAIQRGAFGGEVGDRIKYDEAAVDSKWLEIARCTFVAYSSKRDECERQGVALANEASVVGRGSGKASSTIGSPVCYQVVTKNLSFVETPRDGRLAFSTGNGGISGTEIDQDYGYCTLYDEDGSLYGDVGNMIYKANVTQDWPQDIIDDCRQYLENQDDEPDTSSCPWFVRENSYLLGAAVNSQRRGLATHEQALKASSDCTDVSDVSRDRRVTQCTSDWVTVKYTVPLRVVSGSEVLWAPVAWSTVREESVGTSLYYQDETVVAIHPVYPVDTELAQFSDRWPNPYTHVVPNLGAYQIDFTGDVTAFSDHGDYTFQLIGTGAHDPIDGDDFAIICQLKFLKPSKLLFFVNNRKVDGASRRSQVTVDQVAGYGFQHATTKIVAFVLKGAASVRIQALQVVQVTLAISETFESFFADNLIDPTAIADELAHLVPPSYSASYDPNGGNIVRENRFVRNMASVLQIDPSRIKVTNIVPGNRRRRRLEESSSASELEVQWEIAQEEEVVEEQQSNATANTTNTTQFDELLSVSSTLQQKADEGSLDPGYAVTGMLIVEPEDVCGVPGGNGTTCLDVCGIPNGDGSSCAETPAPTVYTEYDFYECQNATKLVGASNRQEVRLWSSGGFFGTFALEFNGETTAAISVYASANDIEIALADLASIRDDGVSVVGLLDESGSQVSNVSSTTNGVTEMRFGIEFPNTIDETEVVQNVGSVPKVSVDTSSLTGDVQAANVTVTCDGAFRYGFEYSEQRVSIDRSVTLQLNSSSCGIGMSSEIDVSFTPAEVASALRNIGVGMFDNAAPISEGRIEVFQVSKTNSSAQWVVRFYTLGGEALTGCTDVGALSALSADGAMVEILTKGRVPISAMPIDLFAEETVIEEETRELAVVTQVFVCGDGVYMTVEGCDDGNTDNGDGCNSNCTVETGYVCDNQVSYTSSCKIPTVATIKYAQTAYVTGENTSLTIAVERIGDNTTICAVDFTTLDSDAKHRASSNNEFTPNNDPANEGDYEFMNGTLIFGPGVVEKSLTLRILDDETYDGATDEAFVVRLFSSNCSLVNGESTLDAFVVIRDEDPAPTLSPTACPTSMPTTSMPSPVPTSFPSIACADTTLRLTTDGNLNYTVSNQSDEGSIVISSSASSPNIEWICVSNACYEMIVATDQITAWTLRDGSGETAADQTGPYAVEFCVEDGGLARFPTPEPTVSPAPSSFPTPAPSEMPSMIPTSNPSSLPSPAPTAMPSLNPTDHPTILPTPAPSGIPSLKPTAHPTTLPTPSPSAIPSLKPSGHPSSLPTPAPSAMPSLKPSASPSGKPTSEPTIVPSSEPSTCPSRSPEPSHPPTPAPSGNPSALPSTFTDSPSVTPSISPSATPSTQPSKSSEPTPSPSVMPTSAMPSSLLPSPTPSMVPTSSPAPSATRMPTTEPTLSQQPTSFFAPTAAPSTTELAIILNGQLDMESTISAEDILESDEHIDALEVAFSESSFLLTPNSVEVTDVTDVGSNSVSRRRLTTTTVTVDFELTVIPGAFDIEDDDFSSLGSLVAENVSSFVNSGGMTDALQEAAENLGIQFNATIPMQTLTINTTITTVATPDWFPTASPSSSEIATAYEPTSEPTYSPTYSPSYSPSYSPTYSPTYAPTYAPTFDVCSDSSSWFKKNEPSRDCAWVSENVDRCQARGEDENYAYHSCPVACRTCPFACSGDSEFWYRSSPDEGCEWVAETMDRCRERSADGDVPAYVACPFACGICTYANCVDDEDWHVASFPSKECDWVSQNRLARCGRLGFDGTYAFEACKQTCACFGEKSECVDDPAFDGCTSLDRDACAREFSQDGTPAYQACPVSCDAC